jgi:DNA-binding MarR family transcriptional regulator
MAAADYRLLADFRHLLRQFLAFSERAARRGGLTPQQHQALLAIKGAGGVPTVAHLAQSLLVRHNSAVGMANRLVAAGLLERTTDPGDRRRVALALTPKAERLLVRLTSAHREELRRLAPTLKAMLSRL